MIIFSALLMERADAPSRYYEDANNPLSYGLLYENGGYDYARTPDSKRQPCPEGARGCTANTALSASYIQLMWRAQKTFVEERDGYIFTVQHVVN